jgi:hypothetical protein
LEQIQQNASVNDDKFIQPASSPAMPKAATHLVTRGRLVVAIPSSVRVDNAILHYQFAP